MTQLAARPNPRAIAFSHWLRGQMTRKQISQRALGKLIDNESPERGRRQVVRHLSGDHYPSERMRGAYAEVFGEEYAEAGDDEDEESDLPAQLHRLARDVRRLAHIAARREEVRSG